MIILKELMKNIIGRASKLVIRKVIPLIAPLLSIEKVSAKRARHDGIPKPNEAPDKKEYRIKSLIVTFSNKIKVNEVNTPKKVQK
jgi:hypothetical protein